MDSRSLVGCSPRVPEVLVCLVTQSCPALVKPVDCRFFCPWNSPGKNTAVGGRSLLQGIFLEGSNPCFLHCRRFFTI